MAIADERYVALTTYRRNGDPVVTPVWINAVSDGRLGFWTSSDSGKIKRLRNNPTVTVQACSMSGTPKPGSTPGTGAAEIVASGPLFDEVKVSGRKKYGWMVTVALLVAGRASRRKGLAYGDAVVLVRLD